MRTAKYNDFTIFRILLFCIVIAIGVLACLKFVTPPCKHVNTSVVIEEATCAAPGHSYKVCSDCKEQIADSYKTIEAVEHKLTKTVTVEPTCTQEGIECITCSVCDMEPEFKAIPVVAHTPGEAVVKNGQHTLTEGASYEMYVYCTECDKQLSMEKVSAEHTVETISKVTDPTCLEKGTEVTIIYCKHCDKELASESKDIAPVGHSFAWTLSYKNDEAVLEGKCTATECNHKYDPDVDTTYTYDIAKDAEASFVPNCAPGYDVYVATIYCNGEEVAKAETIVNLPADSDAKHLLYVRLKDADGNWCVMNPDYFSDYNLNEDGYIVDENGELLDFLKFAKTDDNGVVYFDASTLGFVKVSNSEWDENGYALGTFKCSADVLTGYEHWVTVRIYNDLAN